MAVIEERQPSRRRGQPIFTINATKYAELERILLPLAWDGTTVDGNEV